MWACLVSRCHSILRGSAKVRTRRLKARTDESPLLFQWEPSKNPLGAVGEEATNLQPRLRLSFLSRSVGRDRPAPSASGLTPAEPLCQFDTRRLPAPAEQRDAAFAQSSRGRIRLGKSRWEAFSGGKRRGGRVTEKGHWLELQSVFSERIRGSRSSTPVFVLAG